MLRLIVGTVLLLAPIVLHLGPKDPRKGSHNQKSHGSRSKNNPFSSRRAFDSVAGLGVSGKKGSRVAFAAPLPKNKTMGQGAGRTLRGGTVVGTKKDSGSLIVKSGDYKLVVPRKELISTKKAKGLKTKRGKTLRK